MRTTFAAIITLAAAALSGCSTKPAPNAEKVPKGAVAYYVRVESSEPGVTIETNAVYAGKTPLRVKVFGDKGGAFHDFGSPEYVVRALPLRTNQFPQTQTFATGARIPGLIFFDLNQKSGSFSVDTFPEN